MKKTVNAHVAAGLPYSAGVVSGGLCFVSGQFGIDKDNRPVGDAEKQAAVALDHVEDVLRLAGLGLDDVVRTTLWLRSLADFEAVNRAYRSRFSREPPARVAIQVADLLFGAAVEIDAVAVVPQR